MRPPARCSRRPEGSPPRETGDPRALCGAEGGVSGGRAPAAPSTTAIRPPRSGPITERRGRGRQEASPLPQPLASAARGRPVPGDAAEGLRGGGQRSPKKGKVRGAALRPRAPAPGDLPAAPARSGRSRRLLAARPPPPPPPAAPSPGCPGMAQRTRQPGAARGNGAEERPQCARSREKSRRFCARRPLLPAARSPRARRLPFYHRRFDQLHRPAPPLPLPPPPPPPAQARSGPAGAAYQRPRCGERNAELGSARPRPCRQRYGRSGDYNSSRAPRPELPAQGANGSVPRVPARPDYISHAALRLKAPRRRSDRAAGRRGGRCGPGEAVGAGDAALSLHAAVASRPLPAPLRPSLPQVSAVGGRAAASFPFPFVAASPVPRVAGRGLAAPGPSSPLPSSSARPRSALRWMRARGLGVRGRAGPGG